MTIGIKTRNFSPNKTELDFNQGGGLGWAPGQEKKFEGVGIDNIRYGKNYSRMDGTCLRCGKYKGNIGTAGEHCSLPANESCIF